MSTTSGTISALDGAGGPFNLRSQQAQNGSTYSQAFQTALEYGGSVAVAPQANTALASGSVLKPGAGTLFALNMNATETGYFMLVDSASIPASGSVSPLRVWYFDSSTLATLDKTFQPPLSLASGIAVLFSSSGPFTFTPATAAQIAGEVA